MAELLGAFLTSLALTGLSVALLRRAQLMDVPNHRSSHTRPVPRGGGAAMVMTICGLAVLVTEPTVELTSLLTVTLFLGVVGLIDDLRSLPSGVRLAAQVLAGLSLAAVLIERGLLSWWWFPLLVVTIVGYVNAFNFMDGINGISGLTAAMVGGWWAWVGHGYGHELLHVLGLVLAGAALGFLPWNAPRARVFLGDVGSYSIGVFVVGLSALALTAGLSWQWALAPLVVYGADTGWVLMKRIHGRRSLTEAHREHVYQRLVDGGWSHVGSAVLCASVAALICVFVGVGGRGLAWWSVPVVLLVTLIYLNAPRLVGRKGKIV